MKKNLFTTLFIVGLIIRIFLATSTYHQDTGAFALSSKYILRGEILTFYDQSGKDISQTIFNYQPLAYIIPSFLYLPFSKTVIKTADTYINSDWQSTQTGQFNLNLLLYKYPFIFADILIFFVIGAFLSGQKNKRILQLFWWLNPISIFVSSLIGQVDIFIALFLVTALYFYQKNNKIMTILFITLSALIKPIGLILLPFIITNSANSYPKKIFESITSTLSGLAIYFLGISPYIRLVSYRHYALFADQINKTVHSGVEISTGTVIPLFFIAITYIYFKYLENRYSFTDSIILILLSSLVFSNFHPQWMVWVIPLLITNKRSFLNTVTITLCWLAVLFSFDDSLHIGSFINSKYSFPQSLTSNDLFQKTILLARAGLVTMFALILNDAKTKE